MTIRRLHTLPSNFKIDRLDHVLYDKYDWKWLLLDGDTVVSAHRTRDGAFLCAAELLENKQ